MTELLGFEDELVINLAITQLEAADINNPLNPKKMQINLTGFLEDKAMTFMQELWKLLLVSQQSEGGIAPDFIQAKKAELLKRKEEIERKKAMMLKLQEAMKQGKPEEENKDQVKEVEKSPHKRKRSRDHSEEKHHKHHKRHHRRDSPEEHHRSKHRRRSRDKYGSSDNKSRRHTAKNYESRG